jgi:hypothetical protein
VRQMRDEAEAARGKGKSKGAAAGSDGAGTGTLRLFACSCQARSRAVSPPLEFYCVASLESHHAACTNMGQFSKCRLP